MVRIFFLPYLGNRSKSDPCSYELFCLESHILSFPKVLQLPPESPCILIIHSSFGHMEKRHSEVLFNILVESVGTSSSPWNLNKMEYYHSYKFWQRKRQMTHLATLYTGKLLTQTYILLADSEHHPAQTRTVLISHPSRTHHL